MDILSTTALAYVFYKIIIWAVSIDESKKIELPSTYEEGVFRIERYKKNNFKGDF